MQIAEGPSENDCEHTNTLKSSQLKDWATIQFNYQVSTILSTENNGLPMLINAYLKASQLTRLFIWHQPTHSIFTWKLTLDEQRRLTNIPEHPLQATLVKDLQATSRVMWIIK